MASISTLHLTKKLIAVSRQRYIVAYAVESQPLNPVQNDRVRCQAQIFRNRGIRSAKKSAWIDFNQPLSNLARSLPS